MQNVLPSINKRVALFSAIVVIMAFFLILRSSENVISSSEMNSAPEYGVISCENICPPTLIYQDLCPCISKKLGIITREINEIKKETINKASIRISFHEYATQSLAMESISEDFDEETKIIKNATLYAKQLNLKNFTVSDLLEIHRRVMIKHGHMGGKFRSDEMFLPLLKKRSYMRMPDPKNVIPAIDDFLRWFSREMHSNTNPIIFAAMSKLLLIRIHPFEDGNGRTSRILLNVILRKNLPFWVTIPANEIIRYYDVIEEVEVKQNLIPYLEYLLKCVKRSLDMYKKDTEQVSYHSPNIIIESFIIISIFYHLFLSLAVFLYYCVLCLCWAKARIRCF